MKTRTAWLLVPIAACGVLALAVGLWPDPKGSEAARVGNVIASFGALAEAAALEADEGTRLAWKRYGIVRQDWEPHSPERDALRGAAEAWSPEQRRAAHDWFVHNATWRTMLHAMVVESFGAGLEPLDHGPSMQAYDPAIFASRSTLALLLQSASEDPRVRKVAEAFANPPAAFAPDEVRRRREKMFSYLGLEDDAPPFVAVFDPLLPATNGVNAFPQDGSIVFLIGPSDPRTLSLVLYHEMAHVPVYGVISASAAIEAALHASQCAFEAVADRYGYETWSSFFSEALVRAMSCRLAGTRLEGSAFPYEDLLAQALERWEADDSASFEQTLLSMLEDLRGRCGATPPR